MSRPNQDTDKRVMQRIDQNVKAVANKINIMKQMFANHNATTQEVNDRMWVDTCLVLIDHIAKLEQQKDVQCPECGTWISGEDK